MIKLSQNDITNAEYEEAAQAAASWTADGNYVSAEKYILNHRYIFRAVMDLSLPKSLYRGLSCKDKHTEKLRYTVEGEELILPAPSKLVSWTASYEVAAVYAGNNGIITKLEDTAEVFISPPEKTVQWFEQLIETYTKNYELRQKHKEYVLSHGNTIKQSVYRSSINKPPVIKEPPKEIGTAIHKKTKIRVKVYGINDDKLLIKHPISGRMVEVPSVLYDL